MTLHQFKLLNEMEQTEIIWRSALVAEHHDSRFDYKLYQIEDFYAELRFYKGQRSVNRRKIFNNTDLLEPYLATINVELLVRC